MWAELFLLCGLVIFIWGLIAESITSRKRVHLIDHWGHSGDSSLAGDEYSRVTYKEHFWSVFFFRGAKSLYGPLLQGVWSHTSNNMNTYDKFWWRCYNEIYLKLSK